jgi:hypothetical protein
MLASCSGVSTPFAADALVAQEAELLLLGIESQVPHGFEVLDQRVLAQALGLVDHDEQLVRHRRVARDDAVSDGLHGDGLHTLGGDLDRLDQGLQLRGDFLLVDQFHLILRFNWTTVGLLDDAQDTALSVTHDTHRGCLLLWNPTAWAWPDSAQTHW